MVKAGGISCLLQVHTKINDVAQNLYVSLRLHVSAHDTKTHIGLVVSGNESRNDGVEGSLVRCVTIEVALFEIEKEASIL